MPSQPLISRHPFGQFLRHAAAILALGAMSAAWGASVTINQAGLQADPTSTQPVVFDVTFSESVSGFTSADVDLSASSAPGTLTAVVAGAGALYTVSVSGATGPGTVIATIPAGVTLDGSNVPNSASTSIDNAVTLFRPSVTINQAVGQADPTATPPVVFDVVFDTAVTGFTGADVNLSASTAPGVLNALVGGLGTHYTVSVTGMTGPGLVVATIPAGVTDGIGNQASTSVDNSVQVNIAPAPVAPTAIPALDTAALIALTLLMLLTGAAVLRR